jgi:hypothetical protein
MKHKTPAALAAWNLYPLTCDPAIVSFLLKNDGDAILTQARELIAQCWQGGPDPALATALQSRLIDYLWEKNDDESGEQGALELLSALEALCRDLLAGGNRAQKAAENALDYRLDYLAENDGADTISAARRQLPEQRAALGKTSGGKALGSDQAELLAALGAEAVPSATPA